MIMTSFGIYAHPGGESKVVVFVQSLKPIVILGYIKKKNLIKIDLNWGSYLGPQMSF